MLKRQRLLLRLRPSLRESLKDCPGIEAELEMQPKRPSGNKRAGEALVSPFQKKTNVLVISDSDSDDITYPGPRSLGSELPKHNLSAGSSKSSIPAPRVPAPFPMDLPLAGPTHSKWPRDFSTREIIDGFTCIRTMMDDDPKMTEKTAHPLVFHGSRYVKATVWKVKSILRNAPASLRTTFTELGDVKEALWGAFTTAMKNFPPDTNDKGKGRAISVSESSTSGTEADVNSLSDSRSDDLDQCPFCDEDLQFEPSEKLLAMYESLKARSHRQPNQQNPQHRIGIHLHVCQNFCEQHQYENVDIPLAEANNWPKKIEFGHLYGRISKLRSQLDHLLKNPKGNHFFSATAEFLGNSPSRKQGVAWQYAKFDGVGAG